MPLQHHDCRKRHSQKSKPLTAQKPLPFVSQVLPFSAVYTHFAHLSPQPLSHTLTHTHQCASTNSLASLAPASPTHPHTHTRMCKHECSDALALAPSLVRWHANVEQPLPSRALESACSRSFTSTKYMRATQVQRERKQEKATCSRTEPASGCARNGLGNQGRVPEVKVDREAKGALVFSGCSSRRGFACASA